MFFTLQSSIEGSFKRSQVLLAKLHPVSHHQKSFPQSLNHICMSVLSKRMNNNLFIHAVTMAHEVKFLTSVTLYAPCASYIKHTKKLNLLSSSCYNIVYPLSLKCKKRKQAEHAALSITSGTHLSLLSVLLCSSPQVCEDLLSFLLPEAKTTLFPQWFRVQSHEHKRKTDSQNKYKQPVIQFMSALWGYRLCR